MNHRQFKEKKLLIASSNPGKIKEIKEFLSHLDIEIISCSQFDIEPPEETGLTFKENADLKAKFYSNATNLPALADDSGLSVDSLDGAPGIYSSRWAGENKDFSLATNKIEEELKKLELYSSPASFTCSLSLCWQDNHIENFEGCIEGNISFPARGNLGFGYDHIFTPSGYDYTFAELSQSLKNKMSHRAISFNKLLKNCF